MFFEGILSLLIKCKFVKGSDWFFCCVLIFIFFCNIEFILKLVVKLFFLLKVFVERLFCFKWYGNEVCFFLKFDWKNLFFMFCLLFFNLIIDSLLKLVIKLLDLFKFVIFKVDEFVIFVVVLLWDFFLWFFKLCCIFVGSDNFFWVNLFFW